ncbi:hypothetical protein SKAU_G00346420 [Synaphobranchus kaupii]|uniref:Uncharacterized protein n=1 Tax=Synaphobranchus kaupii TaxID=118154 RepID=A0A9Q1EJH5_SYNKA|nr:hypothetical protein SKAU_G00346420 [Synaphobranchus kaupii]
MAIGTQYSVALQLSKEDCEKGQLGSNITADFKTVRDTLADEKVYSTGNVVAAIPLFVYKDNIQKGRDHSEYRVLLKLRTQQIKPGCLIVYTYFSPCFSKCLDESRVNDNIIDLLSNLKNQNQNTDIALVFSSLFPFDKKNNTKEQIYNNLKKIPVPLYCCYEGSNGFTCAIFDKNKGKNQKCLSQKH